MWKMISIWNSNCPNILINKSGSPIYVMCTESFDQTNVMLRVRGDKR